jgi:AbrB family looped-hinge helix DNA binding protein
MGEIKTILGEGGRIVIPARFRQALGLNTGDELVLQLEDCGIRVLSMDQAIKQAQASVRRYVAKSRSLSEELIQERREEIAHA